MSSNMHTDSASSYTPGERKLLTESIKGGTLRGQDLMNALDRLKEIGASNQTLFRLYRLAIAKKWFRAALLADALERMRSLQDKLKRQKDKTLSSESSPDEESSAGKAYKQYQKSGGTLSFIAWVLAAPEPTQNPSSAPITLAAPVQTSSHYRVIHQHTLDERDRLKEIRIWYAIYGTLEGCPQAQDGDYKKLQQYILPHELPV